jgi:hypothetical protein
MVILFKSNKSLSITSKSVIMQKENLADKLLFYLPLTYEDITFSDPDVTLYYRDTGNNVHSELLMSSESDKEGYIKYTLPLTSELTENAGELELWLSIVNTSSDSGVTGLITSIIHSQSVFITINEWNDYTLGASVSELEAKIDSLTDKVNELIEKIDPDVSA